MSKTKTYLKKSPPVEAFVYPNGDAKIIHKDGAVEAVSKAQFEEEYVLQPEPRKAPLFQKPTLTGELSKEGDTPPKP